MTIKWRYVAAGCAVFLFFLLKYMPANQLVGRVALPQGVKIAGVSGTVWDGKAQQVIANNLPIQDVKWQLQALPLLWGSINLDVNAGNMRNTDDVAFKGPLSLSAFNPEQVQTEDFLLYLPVNQVLAQVSLPLPVDAGGRFRVNMEKLEFGPECQSMQGYGEWLNATVAGTQGPIALGNFSATLTCKDNNIAILVSEPNAFGLNLDAIIGANFSSVTVSGKFKPDPELPQEVHDAATFFGRPRQDGYISFSL